MPNIEPVQPSAPQVMKRQPTIRVGTMRNHDNNSCERLRNRPSSIWRSPSHRCNGTNVLSRSHEYEGVGGPKKNEKKSMPNRGDRSGQEKGGSRDFWGYSPAKKNCELTGYPWRLEKAMTSRNMGLRPL